MYRTDPDVMNEVAPELKADIVDRAINDYILWAVLGKKIKKYALATITKNLQIAEHLNNLTLYYISGYASNRKVILLECRRLAHTLIKSKQHEKSYDKLLAAFDEEFIDEDRARFLAATTNRNWQTKMKVSQGIINFTYPCAKEIYSFFEDGRLYQFLDGTYDGVAIRNALDVKADEVFRRYEKDNGDHSNEMYYEDYLGALEAGIDKEEWSKDFEKNVGKYVEAAKDRAYRRENNRIYKMNQRRRGNEPGTEN